MFDPTKTNALTFGQLTAEYLEKKKQSGKINKRSLKTLDKFDQNVALVRELIGENTAVANVDFDLCEEIRFKLAKVPANRTKLYKNTSINDMILRAADEGRHLLSSRTQAQYLDTLKSILDLACKKKLLDSNPATSMKPVKEDKVSAQQKRLPFSVKQLKNFYGSQFYLRCMPNAEHPYLEADKKWRFWLPLIALFTGMRANEICQLMTSDISTTEAGTPVINVNANVEIDVNTGKPMPKSVKNESSKRRIPVHQELVNLGFLKFVDSMRVKHENVRLFPTLKGGKYGHVSKYPTRRFNETYLRQDMELEGRQSFHSFRHSFRDALRLIDAGADTLEALGGWSQGNRVSSAYGTVSHPDHQSKIMNKVNYEGLNLTNLYAIDWA